MARLICEEGKLAGLKLIKPGVFPDERGHFMEMYHQAKYAEVGIRDAFVQDNISLSKKHVLRGMHFQKQFPQGKLISAMQGEIWDVAVDMRRDSRTFGQWERYELSSENHHQLYIPAGFAHGFVVTSASALVLYKCTDLYHPGDEGGIAWNDPDVGIAWPVSEPILSQKDGVLPSWRDWLENQPANNY